MGPKSSSPLLSLVKTAIVSITVISVASILYYANIVNFKTGVKMLDYAGVQTFRHLSSPDLLEETRIIAEKSNMSLYSVGRVDKLSEYQAMLTSRTPFHQRVHGHNTTTAGSVSGIPGHAGKDILSAYQKKLVKCANTFTSAEAVQEALLLPKLDFLPSYKNPCIEGDKSGEIACLPYFYVVGQAKCGTTDLYRTLGSHPNVTFGHKEFAWWIARNLGTQTNVESLRAYMGNFRKPAVQIQSTQTDDYHPLITADLSASYFSFEDRWPLYPGNEELREPKFTVAHLIRTLTPNAKVIVSLRHPIDRLYSHYFDHAKSRGYLVATPQGFHDEVVYSLRRMNECLRERGARECAYDVCINHLHVTKVRLRESMYSIFLNDWMRAFPPEQLLVLKFEEYAANRSAILPKIFEFLDTGPMSEAILTRLNDTGVSNRRKEGHRAAGPMLNETRQLLAEFFRPFNRQLADLLHDKRFFYDL